MKNLNRKNVGSIVLFLFMAAGIVSCNKDSNDPVPDPVKENSVEGSWKIAAMNINPAQNGVTDILEYIESMTGNHCISESVFKFQGNGKISGTVPAGCTDDDDTEVIEDNATWKVTENKIQIIEGTEISEYDLEVSKTEMKWTTQEVEDGVTYKLTIVFKKA